MGFMAAREYSKPATGAICFLSYPDLIKAENLARPRVAVSLSPSNSNCNGWKHKVLDSNPELSALLEVFNLVHEVKPDRN